MYKITYVFQGERKTCTIDKVYPWEAKADFWRVLRESYGYTLLTDCKVIDCIRIA